MRATVTGEFLRIPQRSEAANQVAKFGLWLIYKKCLVTNEENLRELMEQYMIEIETIPERYRGQVIGALTR